MARAQSAAPVRRAALTAAVLGVATMASPTARAQSSGSGSQFNSGYNWSSGQLSNAVNVSRTSDANGNHVIVDGVTQTGSDQSVFYAKRTGAGDTYSGAGALGGTAIGNNLQVSVVGSNNTVVVNSTQTNNAPVTATTVLNGQVDLDGN